MKYAVLSNDLLTVTGFREVDPQVVAQLRAANNPRAAVLREFVEVPAPAFDPPTQVAEQTGYLIDATTARPVWTVRALNAAELEARQVQQWKAQATEAIGTLTSHITVLGGSPTNPQVLAAVRDMIAIERDIVRFIRSQL